MDKLFCDLKTDEEKSNFFLSGRGYETGVIAQAIQNDVAMAYHRCSEYRKELEALQSQDRGDAVATAMTLVADRYAHVMAMHLECILLNYDGPFSSDAMNTLSEYRDAMNRIHEAESPTHMGEPLIDHARRIEGEGK